MERPQTVPLLTAKHLPTNLCTHTPLFHHTRMHRSYLVLLKQWINVSKVEYFVWLKEGNNVINTLFPNLDMGQISVALNRGMDLVKSVMCTKLDTLQPAVDHTNLLTPSVIVFDWETNVTFMSVAVYKTAHFRYCDLYHRNFSGTKCRRTNNSGDEAEPERPSNRRVISSLNMGKHKKPNSSDPDGQGGHIGQLQKLESTQMETHRRAKKNPTQDAFESQSINVMAPEVRRPRPRPRPVKPKSKTCPSTSEQRDISPVNDLPSLHLCGPHSRFGFVPPDDIADEDDLEAGHAHDEGLNDNSIQIHHPIVSPSESTDSNIPSPPRRVPKPASNSIALDTVHNVLQEHCAKNRHHCPPDPRTLQKLHEQAVEEPSDGEEDEEPQAVQPHKRLCPSNNVYQTIRFYLHSWKDVLEAAKKKSHLGLVMGGATSTHEAFINKTGIEYLTETLEDFAADNIGVNAGIWDEHKHDMAIILWDDHATMQSEMKKVAHPIAAAKYDILPTDVYDDNEYEEYVCSQVQDLLDGGNFLHNGVDEQGRTNNLANDALGEFCSTFFYMSEHMLAKSFLDEFAEVVPKGVVTLGATMLAATIDKYKTGVGIHFWLAYISKQSFHQLPV
ncbi:hypothetical protein C8R48DRAFT_796882 [Suillus tomentosus]|nr:hypothetical protein C8R48DRAFT_796882 [Suillus tomentosus]